MKLRLTTHAWSVDPSQPSNDLKLRGGKGIAGVSLPGKYLADGVTVEETQRVTSPPITRSGTAEPLTLDVDSEDDEYPLVAIRYPSGALSFHPLDSRDEKTPATRGVRSTPSKKTAKNHFHIPVHFESVQVANRRALRSILPQWLDVILVRVKKATIDKVTGLAVRAAGTALEALWWKIQDRQEGWFRVSTTGGTIQLDKVTTKDLERNRKGRALLLLHGTFSHAESAFSGLATSSLFDDLSTQYGDRIYAFNHFTVSRSPLDNARSLLEGLPKQSNEFDVVTHSRGGLVLRYLTECQSEFGQLADRFKLGHAVLVASPNAGTPLVTPRRWQETVGYVANLLEIADTYFPGHPWVMGAQFVANSIVKLAGRVSDNLPGLASMNMDGSVIATLQDPPGPSATAYSALVANYQPSQNIIARLLDAGVDSFFSGANDLVVPTEGGWLVEKNGPPLIPPGRIGCFGPGGNLGPTDGSNVNHLNFFSNADSIDFIKRALLGREQPKALPNPGQPLPSRRLLRGEGPHVATTSVRDTIPKDSSVPPAKKEPAEPPPKGEYLIDTAPTAYGDALHLTILESPRGEEEKLILASYRGARVLEPFETKNLTDPDSGESGEAGSQFQRIIRFDKRVRNWLEGKKDRQGNLFSAPTHQEVREYGGYMFESLLSGRVRRLYDFARADQREKRLNVILTSAVDWLAQLPWEFAYDEYRQRYLATDEIHLTRNVMTAVPTERSEPHAQRLRILVVAAQPTGTVPLNSQEEEELIRHSFAELLDTGMVEMYVRAHVTAETLLQDVQLGQYDIVHFIGHGKYERGEGEGTLLMEGGDGSIHRLKIRALREILCQRGIKLAFINACETSTVVGSFPQNSGLAQSLVSNGLPAVIANQFPVQDSAAIAYAKHFYWSLARGQSLGEAAREARVALNCRPDTGTIDWAVPVLFALDPEYRVCRHKPESVTKPMALPDSGSKAQTSPVAKATAAGDTKKTTRAMVEPYRVAIADLSRVFTDLSEIVLMLNEVQKRFEFESVDLNVPLGSYEEKEVVKGKRSNMISYLNADRLGESLKDLPEQLGVNHLACITNQWMMGLVDETEVGYNLYGWWSNTPQMPISVFSTAGLPLSPRTNATRRVLANTLVAGLAGYFYECATGKDPMHKQSREGCPFFYNEDRDVKHLAGPQKFDKKCRDKLLSALPATLHPKETLAAFDKILRAFD